MWHIPSNSAWLVDFEGLEDIKKVLLLWGASKGSHTRAQHRDLRCDSSVSRLTACVWSPDRSTKCPCTGIVFVLLLVCL